MDVCGERFFHMRKLISQELPDRKDMGTGDKPNPSPLFYLIQQEKIRKDKRFSDFLFIFAA